MRVSTTKLKLASGKIVQYSNGDPRIQVELGKGAEVVGATNVGDPNVIIVPEGAKTAAPEPEAEVEETPAATDTADEEAEEAPAKPARRRRAASK